MAGPKSGHSFPASFGFSGSCGKQIVKGYQRGGKVTTMPSKKTSQAAPSKPLVPPAGGRLPKGALNNKSPLMPGFKRGGRAKGDSDDGC